MAEILFHGQHGVEANRPEAVRLFEMGAAQGDPGALYNLGVLHLRVCRSIFINHLIYLIERSNELFRARDNHPYFIFVLELLVKTCMKNDV